MDQVRPKTEELSSLNVSFDETNRSMVSVLTEYAGTHGTTPVVAVIALIVCGVACTYIKDPWATFGVVLLVLLFASFVVIHYSYAEKKRGSNELGDGSSSSREARENRGEDRREFVTSHS